MEYAKILNEVVYRLTSDESFSHQYMRNGIHPEKWPRCIGRDLAVEFYQVKESKTLFAAMVKCASAAELLPRKELSYSFNVVLSEVEKAVTYGIGHQLALELKNDPEQVFELVKSIGYGPKLEPSFSLQAEFDAIANDILEDDKTKQPYVFIPDYPQLSEKMGGFNEARVSMFLAASGKGKTTLMLNFILSMLKDMSVLFVNMEMDKKDIFKRIASVINRLNVYALRGDQLAHALGKMASYLNPLHQLYLTDGRSLTRQEIIASIYKRASEGVKFVVIDYDQKIKSSDTREKEWMTVLQTIEELEEVAKATKTHIIVLAQADENNDPKASKRSMQPCSAVIAMYDDEYGNYFLESKKNRFGPKFILAMDADLSMYKIAESEVIAKKPDRELNKNVFR